MAPERIRSTATAVCTRSPRCLGSSTPRETCPTWWPARPTRCSAEATEGGDSICTTRSTAPMSMPSSRLDVATTQGSRPRLRSSSISARCSLDTDPWWARAMTVGAPSDCPLAPIRAAGTRAPAGAAAWASARSVAISLNRAVSRSASRREFANTIVERCFSTRSTTRSSTCGQIEPRRSALPAAEPSGTSSTAAASASSVMSSTGTTTLRSHCLVDVGATTSTGREPPRNRATSSTGRTVADSPIRCAGCSRSSSSRSRDSARCAPRLVPATACTSSTITVSTRAQRLAGLGGEHQEQRLGRGDQDVRGRGPEPAAVGGAGVAGAQADGDVRGRHAEPVRGVPDAGQRRAQVALDVDCERLQRGDVEHPAALLLVRPRAGRQPVDGPQERRQRLA